MKDLYDIAWSTIIPKQLKKNGKAGHVACALEAESGAVLQVFALTCRVP